MKEQNDPEDGDEGTDGTKQRKKIRKIMEDDNLRAETQEALREEEERCKRLAEREQQKEDMRVVYTYTAGPTDNETSPCWWTVEIYCNTGAGLDSSYTLVRGYIRFKVD